ncbi:MAG: hypothetical protein AB9917_06085 [Negativicutes bacterium]
MTTPRLKTLLCLIVVLCGLSYLSVNTATAAAVESRYKNYYSDGWFGTYALREFDKVAPSPGVNWYVEDAQDWLARAQRDGWVVKRKPADIVNGSIIMGYHEGLVWVGIAREVTDKGLYFETVMGDDGKPARYWMNLATIESAIHFKGCILPQRIPGAKLMNPMAGYKTVVGFAGAAWPVQEFDRVAPRPGFNWQGTEREWVSAAAKKGWVTDNNPVATQTGSLLLFYNPKLHQTRVAMVRDVLDSTVVFDYVDPAYSRVVTARLTIDQLLDNRAFGGFVFDGVILPVRTKR